MKFYKLKITVLCMAALCIIQSNFAQSPGGINTNLVAWFKAGTGNNSATGGPASTEGGNVAQWLNQVSGGINVANTGALGTTTAPLFYATTPGFLVNYNPSVYFNGSNSYGLYNAVTNVLGGSATGFHFIVVGRDDAGTASGTLRSMMGNGTSGNNPGIDLQKDGASFNGWNFYTNCSGEYNGGNATVYNGGGVGLGSTTVPGTITSQINNRQPQIFGLSGTGLTSSCAATTNSWVDAYKVTTTSTNIANQVNDVRFYIGSSEDAPWTGEINEVIAYKDQLSDAQLQQVNSYLAIKYGITLGQGNNAAGDYKVGENRAQYDYKATDGSSIWAAGTLNTYRWHIAGVGRDDNSGLAQKQSTSVNYNANNQVTMGLGSISATGNAGNANTFTNDRSYLVWGDNGNTSSLQALGAAAPTFTFNGYSTNTRMQRIWAVQSTNLSQKIQVSVPGSTIGTVATAGCQKLCLVIASDAAFTNIVSAKILSGTAATSYTANVFFPSGTAYFTFARVEELASGDVYLPTVNTPSTATDLCNTNGWQYYYADAAMTQKIFALNANGNTIPAYGTGANQLSGKITYQSAPYQVTDGTNTTHIMGRTLTITDNTGATYNVNGGMKVRVYYNQQELNNSLVTNPFSQKWFKHAGDINSTTADQTPRTINNSIFYTGLTTGTEDGENYVEYQVNSFSTFGFASNAGDALTTPLPIALLSFTGLKQNNTTVQLSWKTTATYNVKYFEVEAGTDGATYQTVATVSAYNLPEQYTYTQAAPFYDPTTFYRLKIVDADGSVGYSDIIHFTGGTGTAKTVAVYPNPVPANTAFTVQLNGYNKGAKAGLYNSIGQLLFSKLLLNGNNVISPSQLPAGVYYLKLVDEEPGSNVVQKIIIK